MTRPRGFINDWMPIPKTATLINDVREILDDNSEILPLTLRQIFYMLVSNYGFSKTEKDYKRLCEIMNKARRAQFIGMEHIRDDGVREETPDGWNSEDSLIATFHHAARNFRFHRQMGQDRHLMIWCEAGGMVPQLATYCENYGVPVISSGGFDSVTTKHNFAERIANDYDSVLIMHIGDHDPSGVHMCSSLDEDLQAFVDHYGGEVEVQRLAVTPDQVSSMNLPTAPPKKTDNRSFHGLTTQAEAIPPKTLRDIVVEAILMELDMDVYDDLIAEEANVRRNLLEKLSDL